jgi:hypothetical protein
VLDAILGGRALVTVVLCVVGPVALTVLITRRREVP